MRQLSCFQKIEVIATVITFIGSIIILIILKIPALDLFVIISLTWFSTLLHEMGHYLSTKYIAGKYYPKQDHCTVIRYCFLKRGKTESSLYEHFYKTIQNGNLTHTEKEQLKLCLISSIILDHFYLLLLCIVCIYNQNLRLILFYVIVVLIILSSITEYVLYKIIAILTSKELTTQSKNDLILYFQPNKFKYESKDKLSVIDIILYNNVLVMIIGIYTCAQILKYFI